jgi:hypothetical protein
MIPSTLVLYLQEGLKSTHVERHVGLQCTLPVNSRLGWTWLELTNALSYNCVILIITIKSVVVQAP